MSSRLPASLEAMLASVRVPPPPPACDSLVLLSPQLPPRPDAVLAGWSGGDPTLPASAAWPRLRGRPACFLCQIDLGLLPRGLWGGLGPRRGWLRLFLAPRGPKEVAAVHSGELGVPRSGPDHADADWTLPPRAERPVGLKLPRWHLRLGLPPRTAAPDPLRVFDLSDPRVRPFDRCGLRILANCAVYEAREWAGVAAAIWRRVVADNEPHAARSLAEDFGLAIADAEEKTLAIARRIWRLPGTVRRRTIETLTDEMAAIPLPRLALQPGEVRATRLGQDPGDALTFWHRRYVKRLHDHARHVYVDDPDALPRPLRGWLEAGWATEAANGAMALGGPRWGTLAPTPGHVVLMQLRSSEALGLNFGDLDTLAVLIRPSDLAAGRFDRLRAEIVPRPD